jgi:Fic family protein
VPLKDKQVKGNRNMSQEKLTIYLNDHLAGSVGALELVDHLFMSPAVTPETAGAAVGVERRQALNQINKLMELKILKEATGGRRNRIFVAEQIVRAIDDTHSRAISVGDRSRRG